MVVNEFIFVVWFQPESLFSDIGGTVGLYIGFSLITLCEFASVCILLIRFCCKKYFCGEKHESNDEETPTNDSNGQQLNNGIDEMHTVGF